MESVRQPRMAWTFLTNHARVLSLVARDPGARLRDVAEVCGLTERAVQAIVADLEGAGYLERSRVGRRNHYRVVPDALLRHPAEAGLPVGALLEVLAHSRGPRAVPRTDPATGLRQDLPGA
ncbi:MarR family transcriptional regulator [Streptacidiphilus sp. PB12-B1b]|uniref:helix-turn-helix transcriptional regulator n=1 Tax=Streptacidiphilus sp. PB12-B1b TaxID=2705012 RepID=UPI0015FBC4F7|nr:helix-turn-helix domain-containing protein [Streptacidiphilus sp. PB12-B1b]QMU76718.1 MarR family transcriptional regulator [Streptacidiphilus sp. PB12-B1b]